MAEGAQMRIRALGRDAILNELRNVRSDTAGLKIMQKKSEILAFRISELKFSACMILKQEALSANAEFATPKECILGHEESYDGVLFGRPSDLLSVAKKCLIQPFGLKELGGRIQEYVSKRPAFLKPSIMAVVNITPDSFYKDSRMELSRAIEHIEWLIQRGVEIIDIGGASSRPGSDLIDDEVELARLREIFAYIKEKRLFDQASFSIDSYNPKVVQAALQSGFKIINDVSGVSDCRMFELASSFDARLVLMHTQGTPKEMTKLTEYKDIFESMDQFFSARLEECAKYGIRDVILDIGFGFAKNTDQNLALVKNLAHFQRYDLPILVGASRKSSVQKIIDKDASNALCATLALHFLALQNGASILRVHDYEEHKDMIKIWEAYCAI